jgi:hypothetical protein
MGTEHRGRVVNTPASYSGGPEFKSRPKGFRGFPQSLKESRLQSVENKLSTYKHESWDIQNPKLVIWAAKKALCSENGILFFSEL